MPPKKSVTVARANLAKARAKKAAKSSAAATSVKGVILGNGVAPSAQESHPGGSGLSGRKRAADDSPKRNMVNINKKTKVAAAGAKLQDDSDSVEDENSCPLLSDEDFEKLCKLEETLSSHMPASMRHIFKGIRYEKAVPQGASLKELIELVIDELKSRAIAGKDIAGDLEVIYDVDDKWHDGEYDDEVDDDDDGLSKGVRKRLNDAESMLQYMAGGALKSILRQLNPYAHGGTNRAMAGIIVATLENLAKDGSEIKREYMIVKSFGSGCHDTSDPDLNFGSGEDEDDD